jgi:hypothetical protein
MGWEKQHPLQTRGRELPNRGADHYQTVSLIVHKTGPTQCLVALVVTDGQGKRCKDTRLGECWIDRLDSVGSPLSPFRLLQSALEKLLAQPGERLLPEGTDTRA